VLVVDGDADLLIAISAVELLKLLTCDFHLSFGGGSRDRVFDYKPKLWIRESLVSHDAGAGTESRTILYLDKDANRLTIFLGEETGIIDEATFI